MNVHILYTCDDVHFCYLMIHYLQFILRNTAWYSPVYTRTSSLHANYQPACAPDWPNSTYC